MPILVKGDDVRSGTKANAYHSQLGVAWDQSQWINELNILGTSHHTVKFCYSLASAILKNMYFKQTRLVGGQFP